ncbi:thymidylate synthase [Sulfitobacter sp. D35]|uniref:thymidylate synthase n=1 Tax=Sulfitobacter sp. D35 TaxID=3083252 RepID=UPI00296EFCF9|nr:thymidylate synthase [Sulfitobacter sp. D35]MDW4499658.1 thymidylate synthase [Sulfitobacter sp. D35]
MKLPTLSLVLCLSLAACGDGNPFEEDSASEGPGTEEPTGPDIPEELSGNLRGFSYNPNKETLTIRGVDLEDSPFRAKYRRRANLDRAGYEAYTQQDGSLDRHSTAYVKDIRGTRAAVVVTGGQFEEFFAGGRYSAKTYSAPVDEGSNRQRGLISYAGRYVGMLNIEGSGEDLIEVKDGTPQSFRSKQAAEVTGRALVTGSFSDRRVDGIITRRKVVDYVDGDGDTLRVRDLALDAGNIDDNGSFTSTVSQGNTVKGSYGGVFGGKGASEVAGVLKAEEHINGFDGIIEHGVFVMGACGKKGQDRLCKQPKP